MLTAICILIKIKKTKQEVTFLIQKNVNSRKLEENINSLLKKEIYKNRNKNIECCPICGGKKYIKHGSYKGIQRYKCKECGKTFSNTTNSLWSYSKKGSKYMDKIC